MFTQLCINMKTMDLKCVWLDLFVTHMQVPINKGFQMCDLSKAFAIMVSLLRKGGENKKGECKSGLHPLDS